MCGICGAIDLNPGRATELVRRMTPTMRHRGPDDEGYLDGSLGGPFNEPLAGSFNEPLSRYSLALGMRRLSIIDLAGGHQPIFNEDESVAAILNGEIYNFQALTNELQGLGHRFRTRADSEVIVHAYEEWGPGCVRRFDGMFALAVYDRRRGDQHGDQIRGDPHDNRRPGDRGGDRSPSTLPGDRGQGTLFLARDRFGIKPLYYYLSNPVAGVGDARQRF